MAQQAAGTSGIDPSVLKKMLPMLAMVVTGYLAKQRAAEAPATDGDIGGLLGGILGGNAGGARAGGGLGRGLGGLASMLDADGDGNPLDDVIRMMGRAQVEWRPTRPDGPTFSSTVRPNRFSRSRPTNRRSTT